MVSENFIVDIKFSAISIAFDFGKPLEVVISARSEKAGRWERYTNGSKKNTRVGLFEEKIEEISYICMCLNHH